MGIGRCDDSNLLTEYGEVTLASVRTYEETYSHLPCRAAQETHMLYECIMNSLSAEGKNKLRCDHAEYMIGNYTSGILLLKVLIHESHLDTNATASSVRTQLSELDTYLPTIGHDITKFNQYVKLSLEGLLARGETTTDLLTNLFKGYLTSSDKVFVKYIIGKQEQYEEGKHIEPVALMGLADIKFKTLVQKGQWNAPTPEEEKILALETQVKTMAKNHKKSGVKPKPDTSGGDRQKNPKQSGEARPNWLKHNRPPHQSEMSKPKMWKEFPYHWCCKETGGNCSGNWRRHQPSKCEGLAGRKRDNSHVKPEGKTVGAGKPAAQKRKHQLAKAYAAIADAEGAEESDE
jgi:hypothetical protein